MQQRATAFRDSVLNGPARIPSEVAANLVGIHPLVFSAMAREGIVSCLGSPRANGTTRYYGPYVLQLRENRDFLDQSERFARLFWRERNWESALKESKGPIQRGWTHFPDSKERRSYAAPLGLDPVVGIGVAEVLLGFAVHEIRILVNKKVLPVMGTGMAAYQHKRFFLRDLFDCYGDPQWVDKAERTVTDYWRHKNTPGARTAEQPC